MATTHYEDVSIPPEQGRPLVFAFHAACCMGRDSGAVAPFPE